MNLERGTELDRVELAEAAVRLGCAKQADVFDVRAPFNGYVSRRPGK